MNDISLIPVKAFEDEREEKQARGVTDCKEYSQAGSVLFLSTENRVSYAVTSH